MMTQNTNPEGTMDRPNKDDFASFDEYLRARREWRRQQRAAEAARLHEIVDAAYRVIERDTMNYRVDTMPTIEIAQAICDEVRQGQIPGVEAQELDRQDVLDALNR